MANSEGSKAQQLLEAIDGMLARSRRMLKRRSLQAGEDEMEQAWAAFFQRQGAAFLALFAQLQGEFAEAITEADWASRFRAVSGATDEFEALLVRLAGEAMMAGAADGARAIGLAVSFDLNNPRAVEYLRRFGAELVTKIGEVTREQLRALIARGTSEGWSYGKMAGEIAKAFVGFTRKRGRLIAITELGNAYEFGNYWVIKGLQGQGLDMEKHWSTIGDSRVSDGCEENQGDGWIPLDQPHSSGHLYPLRFPGCRCDELYRRVSPAVSY